MARAICCKLLLWALALSTLFLGSIVGTIFWFHGEKLLSLFRGEDRGMQATLDVLHEAIFAACVDAHTPAFAPNETLSWADDFRAEWMHIRDELYTWERTFGAVPAFTDIDDFQLVQAPHKKWSSLWLKMYGTQTDASHYFPHTMAALARTSASTAMFSIMEPGKGLEKHRGDFKAVLRYHLALEVPPLPRGKTEQDEPLRLMVAEKLFYTGAEEIRYQPHVWEEGQNLLFDDTFIHYVQNERTTGRRVVLFMDVPRTDCGLVVNGLFHLAVNYIVRYVPRVRHIVANANAFMKQAEEDKLAEAGVAKTDEL
jgi:aspartyl/asparaginyl beta-hydroxylase (cupin superfamily)